MTNKFRQFQQLPPTYACLRAQFAPLIYHSYSPFIFRNGTVFDKSYHNLKCKLNHYDKWLYLIVKLNFIHVLTR